MWLKCHACQQKKGDQWSKCHACHAKMNARKGTKDPWWDIVGGYIGPLRRHAGYLEADLAAMGDHVALLGRDLEAMPDLSGATWVPCGAPWGRLEGYEVA